MLGTHHKWVTICRDIAGDLLADLGGSVKSWSENALLGAARLQDLPPPPRSARIGAQNR
jgi:hypothetical protein